MIRAPVRVSVIGWPIAHSRSPVIHGHWLKTYGIVGNYTRESVAPAELPKFIDSLRGGERIGCNVTLPHKESSVSLVDEPDERARRIGALNTIWRQGDRLLATSSDGAGFMANLKDHLPQIDVSAAPVTILGAGGSARALVDELLRQGAGQIVIYNRTLARAQTLAAHFGPLVVAVDTVDLPARLAQSGLMVNTTSAGLNGDQEQQLPWTHVKPEIPVADIVYTPLVTAFLQKAQATGHPTVPGLGMLLHQAVVGFEKWFGVRPVVTQELHDIVARDIDPDFRP